MLSKRLLAITFGAALAIAAFLIFPSCSRDSTKIGEVQDESRVNGATADSLGANHPRVTIDGADEEIDSTKSSDSDVKFTYHALKESENRANNWGAIDFQLSRKIPRKQLIDLAQKIRQAKPKYANLSLFFTLPGWQKGGPWWATASFEPLSPQDDANFEAPRHLDVDIRGFSDLEESQAVGLAKNQPVPGKLLGVWIEGQYAPQVIIIYDNGNGTFLRQIFKGATEPKDLHPENDVELHTEEREGAKVFVDEDGDDYYALGSHGNLELYDSEGYITTATKVK